MSLFVVITFDLMNAQPSDYSVVQNELDQLDLAKYLTGKRRGVQLPANTYAAEFDEDDYDNSSELRDYLTKSIVSIFTEHKLSGKYFINVGKKWAWKVGNVN